MERERQRDRGGEREGCADFAVPFLLIFSRTIMLGNDGSHECAVRMLYTGLPPFLQQSQV